MSVRTDLDYISEMMKINCSTQSSCAVTGNIIEDMEPHLSLFRKLRISKKGLKIITGDIKSLDNRNSPVTIGKGEHCDVCEKYKKSCINIKIVGSSVLELCRDCEAMFLDECKYYIDKIENDYLYYDESGFAILKTEESQAFRGMFEESKKHSNLYIDIGFDDISPPNFKVNISNIETLIKEISESSVNKHSIQMCDICKKDLEKHFSIGSRNAHAFYICPECKNEIELSLQEFLNDNLDKIISKVI